LEAIRRNVSAAKVEYASGADIEQAAVLAGRSDVAIVFVTQYRSEEIDVPLGLSEPQDELVRQIAAANPHTVVVLETGGAVLMPWLANVQAVLEAWYPGIRGGEAIANLLFGSVNPSGKLPITFPKLESDLPPRPIERRTRVQDDPEQLRRCSILTIAQCTRTDVPYLEGLNIGYKWYDTKGIEPLFPFGHGLSYTQYAYSGLKVTLEDSNSKTASASVRVTFTVENTGTRAGAEIAQIYLAFPAVAGEPPKRLVAWERVPLDPDEKRSVTLRLNPKSMSIWSVEQHGWELPAGEYTLYVGASSRDLRLQRSIQFPRRQSLLGYQTQ